MTDRTEIFTDGSYNDQTRTGGWAAVVVRATTARETSGSSQEMELRALLAAVKMAEGPCTVVSDHEGIVNIAQQGMKPRWAKELWDELYAGVAGKDITFEWRKRDTGLGSRLAHQLARDAAKGRG